MVKKYLITIFFFFGLCSLLFAQMFGQEPVERERLYDVQHIKIEVKLDLVNASVDGRVTTSIVPLRTISSFTADAGRSITSPAAIFAASCGARMRIGIDAPSVRL